tara:strand:+ start:122 stop:574 length:453 start_codon:yes stop_codon:yes gene_type:complete
MRHINNYKTFKINENSELKKDDILKYFRDPEWFRDKNYNLILNAYETYIKDKVDNRSDILSNYEMYGDFKLPSFTENVIFYNISKTDKGDKTIYDLPMVFTSDALDNKYLSSNGGIRVTSKDGKFTFDEDVDNRTEKFIIKMINDKYPNK